MSDVGEMRTNYLLIFGIKTLIPELKILDLQPEVCYTECNEQDEKA
jgi:hypothetical protein